MFVLNLKVWNWKSVWVSGGRDRYCYRQCCGMCGGVFAVCKVFGKGRDLKHCWATFWAAGPSHSLSSVLAPFCLKRHLPRNVTLALLPLSFWFLLSWPLLVKLTLRLSTHWQIVLTVKIAVSLHWRYYAFIVPQVHVWSVKCRGECQLNI